MKRNNNIIKKSISKTSLTSSNLLSLAVCVNKFSPTRLLASLLFALNSLLCFKVTTINRCSP